MTSTPHPPNHLADFESVQAYAMRHDDPYAQDIAIQLMKAWQLFAEIANSDMAMREEDEGEVSSLLEKVRTMIPMEAKL